MTATAAYLAAAARRTSQPWWYVQIGGVGQRFDADGRAAYKFCSLYLGAGGYPGGDDYAAGIVLEGNKPSLSFSSDALNIGSDSVDIGSAQVTLIDKSGVLAAAFAFSSPGAELAASGRVPVVVADISRTATTVDVTDASVVVNPSMLFLDQEAVRVHGISLGGGVGGSDRLTITRAQWGTFAALHFATAPLRSTMSTAVGQPFTIGRSFRGLVSADELVRWPGILTENPTHDGLRYTVRARTLTALTEREVMRQQGRFRVVDGSDPASPPVRISIRPDAEDDALFPDTQADIWIGSSSAKGAMHVEKPLFSSDNTRPRSLVLDDTIPYQTLHLANPGEWRELAAGDTSGSGGRTETVWEVAPTNPALADVRFPSPHPIGIVLAWILSIVGDGTNNATWDALPDSWGLEVPASLVDVAGATRELERLLAAADNLVYGIDGDAGFALRGHVEEELFALLGLYLVTRGAALGVILPRSAPAWLSGLVVVDHSEIQRPTVPALAAGSESVDAVAIETGYSWISEKMLDKVTTRPDSRAMWRLGSVESYELHTLRPGERQQARWMAAQRLWSQQRTRHTFESPVSEHLEHQVEVGDPVTFTSAAAIDPRTGTRGVSALPCIVTKRTWDGGTLKLSMAETQPGARAASIAPAGIGTLSGVGTTLRLHHAADPVFTEDGRFDDYPLDKDWFDGGAVGVGDMVQILNGDTLAPKTTGLRVTGIAFLATWWYLAFDGAHGAATGDYVVFEDYETANVTARQKQWAFLSDSGQLGASDDAPYIYAG